MAAILHKWFLAFNFLFLSVLPGRSAPADLPLPKTPVVHPFYISVTEINQNAQEKTLEISCKLFADDFEEALKKNYKTVVDLTSEKDKAALDKFIPDYINRHLALAVDGKPVKLTYVGFEKEKESAYCYFQAENVPSVKKLDVNISILHDYSNRQINIVHAVVNGKRQSTKLDYPAKQAGFSF
jgi:hypothetical protein